MQEKTGLGRVYNRGEFGDRMIAPVLHRRGKSRQLKAGWSGVTPDAGNPGVKPGINRQLEQQRRAPVSHRG